MKRKLLELKLVFLIVLTIIFFSYLQDSYEHGIGYEIFPPVKLGDKLVAFEVTSSQYQDPDNTSREITFSLFDTKTGITIKDVTYNIEAKKGGKFLFDSTFATSDGILVIDFLKSDSKEISVTQENKASFFDSLIGAKKNVIQVRGEPFNTGGLYQFKVIITTANSFSNILEEPIVYDVGLSVPQRNYYQVNDPNFGLQELSVISYYDEIKNFNYDSNKKAITFSMPFEWNLENVNQTSVVHEEITLSKTFGDLMISEFSAQVNGFELPDTAITIDGFSEVQRIVHIVMNQNDLFDLLQKQKENSKSMNFLLKPKKDDLPLSTVTGNGQFRIVLDWEPKEIRSGTDAVLYFDILDVFLKNKPISVSYDLSIIHQGKTIFTQSGISTNLKEEHNQVKFSVPKNIQGVVTIQFDNLNGNSLARVGLPILVDRIDSVIIIPEWIRTNAGWWSEKQITDTDFVLGIEYMIKNNIIKLQIENGEKKLEEYVIPEWIRNNAGWWSENLISDKEFVNGLEYLISNGIISV